MDFAEIIYEKKDRVATVTMNRPEKMNAWTPKMGAEMRAAMLDAERDPSIGAIIVTGAGRAYCAGADMGALSNIAAGHAGARTAEA
ncbi:enoyl-CoA hydratase-related protein, partial [Candidatus Binatus sp.]